MLELEAKINSYYLYSYQRQEYKRILQMLLLCQQTVNTLMPLTNELKQNFLIIFRTLVALTVM